MAKETTTGLIPTATASTIITNGPSLLRQPKAIKTQPPCRRHRFCFWSKKPATFFNIFNGLVHATLAMLVLMLMFMVTHFFFSNKCFWKVKKINKRVLVCEERIRETEILTQLKLLQEMWNKTASSLNSVKRLFIYLNSYVCACVLIMVFYIIVYNTCADTWLPLFFLGFWVCVFKWYWGKWSMLIIRFHTLCLSLFRNFNM